MRSQADARAPSGVREGTKRDSIGKDEMETQASASPPAPVPAEMMWLEITGRCQLGCGHCYAESGPDRTHGKMTAKDWHRVVSEAAELGTRFISVIGGEPTMNPALPALVRGAVERELDVEVFTNLVNVSELVWGVLRLPRVRIATSYYTDYPAEHAKVVGRRSPHLLEGTRRNIKRARDEGIPVRAGVIRVMPGQRIEGALRDLNGLGVTDVTYDDVRAVGRGQGDRDQDEAALCGACTRSRLAVTPSGEVFPCVFARWDAMSVGNVLEASLPEIVTGPALKRVRQHLDRAFSERSARDSSAGSCVPRGPVEPDVCPPQWPCLPHEGIGCAPKAPPPCAPARCGPDNGQVPKKGGRPRGDGGVG